MCASRDSTAKRKKRGEGCISTLCRRETNAQGRSPWGCQWPRGDRDLEPLNLSGASAGKGLGAPERNDGVDLGVGLVGSVHDGDGSALEDPHVAGLLDGHADLLAEVAGRAEVLDQAGVLGKLDAGACGRPVVRGDDQDGAGALELADEVGHAARLGEHQHHGDAPVEGRLGGGGSDALGGGERPGGDVPDEGVVSGVVGGGLGVTDDGVEGRDAVDGEVSDGGLGAQHEAVDAVEDGVGDVGHLGAGGARVLHHGVQAVARKHDELAVEVCLRGYSVGRQSRRQRGEDTNAACPPWRLKRLCKGRQAAGHSRKTTQHATVGPKRLPWW